MGFLVGMLIGAVAALLYAPKAGDEMREEMRTRADELKRRAEDLQRIAQRLTGEAQTMGSTLIEDAKQEWEGATAGGSTGSGPGAGTGAGTGSGPTGGRTGTGYTGT